MVDYQVPFKKRGYLLGLSLMILISFCVLFTLRSLDDNRLASWKDVFSVVKGTSIFLLLIPGLFLSYMFAKLSLHEHYSGLFLLLISFAVGAVFWREPELIVDASRYFTQAKHLALYGPTYFLREWGRDIPAWTDMPVVPFIYGLIFRFFGESRVYIQACTTLMFSLTIVLTYRTGKALWDRETGFFAGLLMLGYPYLLTQVPLMLVDVPVMFFLMLSVYTFLEVLDRGTLRNTLFASVSIFLTVFVKYSTWVMLSVLIIIAMVYMKKDRGQTLRRGGAVLFFSLVLIGAFVLYKFDVISSQVALLLSYQKPGLARWQESDVSTFFFHTHLFVTAAAGYSVFTAWKGRDWKFAVIGWLALLTVVILQVQRIRYLLPVFPFIALMASYGMRSIVDQEIRKYFGYSAAVTSLIIAVFAYLPFTVNMSAVNLKKAGEYLDQLGIKDVEVYTVPLRDPSVNPSVSVPILDLYTQARLRYQYRAEEFFTPEDVDTSSLRFTWQYRNPQYYTDGLSGTEPHAVVVISGDADSAFPEEIKKNVIRYYGSKIFDTAGDQFRYKTIVTVFTNY